MGKIDEPIGFLTGVASDGVLNDLEVDGLSGWLNRNETIREKWPASVIVNRLNNVLEDCIITDEERHDLMVTVNQITGMIIRRRTLATNHPQKSGETK